MSYFPAMFILIFLSFTRQSATISIECFFRFEGSSYFCRIYNVNTTTDNETITSANGNHLKGFNNNMVMAFEAHSENNFVFPPLGLGVVFPNLNSFTLFDVGLKLIRRAHFKDMENVKFLYLARNQIETLPEDVFYDLPRLECLELDGNLIKILPENLLENCQLLTHFRADHNLFETLPETFFDLNDDLIEVSLRDGKLEAIQVDFTKFTKLREVYLEGNPCTNQIFVTIFDMKDTIEEFQNSLNETCWG